MIDNFRSYEIRRAAVMKLDKDTVEFIDFRHEAFDKKLKEINDLVTGRNTELSAFISDENGNISDEKIEDLISELLNGFIDYKRLLSSHYTMSEKTFELYKCFLYCTIQGVAYNEYVDIPQYTEVSRVTTFSDILDILYESFAYKDLKSFLVSEYFGYPLSADKGFFGCCDMAYYILKDQSITAEYSEEEAELIKDTYKPMPFPETDDIDDDDDDYFKQIDREQLAQKPAPSTEELLAQYYGLDSENEQLISDEELEYCQKVQDSHDEWKNSVVDPDKFIATYLRYRELYFSVPHPDMRKDIEKMIDVFLYEKDLSAFALGNKYGMITYRTDQYRKVLRSEIRKARCE